MSRARPTYAVAASLLASIALCMPAARAGGPADPFDSERLHAAAPGTSTYGGIVSPCSSRPGAAPLTLSEVVDYALCNNPQTRLAWANARAQAAAVGVTQSAYLPTLSAGAERSRHSIDNAGTAYYQTNASISAAYLIFDFGGRAANLESARQLMTAVAASQDAVLQSVFLAAVQAYYQSYAAQAAVAAAAETERAAVESLKAATARHRIGTATAADELQAQTAAAQATLNRIQAEGNARTALGVVANAMGLDAQETPLLAAPADATPDADFERNLTTLITAAKRTRPDLMAAEAQVSAARADIDAARAAGRPSLSLGVSESYANPAPNASTRNGSIGLTLTVPLFTGYSNMYRVRGAEAQLAARTAQRDQLSRQVSLDVWRSYYALTTSLQSVRASGDLLASATASEAVARGRYQAGAGSILDLLSAQGALAAARQQNIQAVYDWRIAKAALAAAMGQLDFDMVEANSPPPARKTDTP